MPLFGKSESKGSKSATNAGKNATLTVTTVSEKTSVISGRAEEVFGKQFLANTVADSQADKIDDEVSKVTNLYKSGKALYTTNKDLIDGAWSAMATATGVGRTIDDWIGPINKVMAGLEGLAKAQPFPFVELAVTLLNGVVQLELQRRQNSTKARALILQMADMMGALLQLHFVEDPTLVTDSGDSVQGRIQNLMKDIEADINATGNLINKYHQHSLASKFFRSGQYVTLFKAAADGLVSRKGDIQFACTIHTTVTVDEIRKQVRETNTMILKLTAIIEHQSDKEKQWEQTVQQYGGRKRVLENPDLTMEVAAVIEGRDPKTSITGLPGSTKPADKSKQDAPKPGSKDQPGHSAVLASGEVAFSRKELLELQQPLEKILKDSLPYYENKLLAQVEVIKNQINKSTLQILSRLEAGSHEKITHPDIRFVWKEMGWRSSVKAKVFVMGLHDYYLDRYAVAAAKSSSLTTTTTTTTLTVTLTSPGESRPASPVDDCVSSPTAPRSEFGETTTTTTQTLTNLTTSDASILADKEYLEYLTMPYVGAIIEAFDDDASGFVRISEVNDFCASIPPGWTLLQWIAYWARGWMVEASQYSLAIWDIYDGMKYKLGNSLSENSNMIFRYLNDSDWVGVTKMLTWCAAAKSVYRTDTTLDELVKARMQQKEARLEQSLEGFGFTLDSSEALRLVVDVGRPEKDLFSIFYVIMRRHLRLLTLAKTKILDERELLDAQTTLIHLTQAVRNRVEQLESNFKHQGLDDDIEMSRVAGGVYECLHNDDVGDYEEPVYPEEDSEKFWDILLPDDLDLEQFSKSDLWFDTSAYTASSPKDDPSADMPVSDAPASSTPAAKDTDKAKSYRSPLIIPKGQEFITMVSEHQNNLSEIRSEVTTFTQELAEQLNNRRLTHPVPEVLALIDEIEAEVHLGNMDDEWGSKLFRSAVQLACSLAKLPDVEDEDAPKGIHDGFIPRLRQALEPISNELAWALRLFKAYREANAPPEEEETQEVEDTAKNAKDEETTEETAAELPAVGTPAVPKEKVLDPELSVAIDRTSRHATIINSVIDAHTGTGIVRFRAAGELVLNQIRERRYRFSWPFLKRRRALRNSFVPAYAVKMKFEEANPYWGFTLIGTGKADEKYNLLLKEVATVDRPLWQSLARLEYRRMIVHITCLCDSCELLIVGTRYTCLYCEKFHLCEACSHLRLRETHDTNGKLHHVWHPLVKLARPMLEIRQQDRSQFSTMVLRLHREQDISPSAIYEDTSDEENDEEINIDGDADNEAAEDEDVEDGDGGDGGDDEDNEDEDEDPGDEGDNGDDNANDDDAEEEDDNDEDAVADDVQADESLIKEEQAVVAQDFAEGNKENGGQEDTKASHQYECAECKKTTTGTRYLTLPRFDSLQYCPECETILSTPEGHLPLLIHLRQLLKVTLPLPEDDENTTVAGDEDEDGEQEKITKQLTSVDERLVTLEGKFEGIDGRMQSLETKLDQILSMLIALHPGSAPVAPGPSDSDPAA